MSSIVEAGLALVRIGSGGEGARHVAYWQAQTLQLNGGDARVKGGMNSGVVGVEGGGGNYENEMVSLSIVLI